jgi:hypothetical protein
MAGLLELLCSGRYLAGFDVKKEELGLVVAMQQNGPLRGAGGAGAARLG